MPGNTFGHLFRITTFGESHGKANGVIIDGCPAGLELREEDIQKELDRRRPGTSHLTTTRQEEDKVEILSGIFEGRTTGTPIALIIQNKDHIARPYEKIKDLYRPGHADFTYDAKYGFRDWRGGGRASARETVSRVAAGAVAKKILALAGVKIFGYVSQIGAIRISDAFKTRVAQSGITPADEKFIESNPLRCPESSLLKAMIKEVENARKDMDSVGGIVEIIAQGVPAGLGEPVFNKLSAELARGIMSIPAVKGFEIGDGFAAASKRGSQNNDPWVSQHSSKATAQKAVKNTENRSVPKSIDTPSSLIGTATNHAGGMLGGISNGEPIVVRFALKPASSIAQKQQTVDRQGHEATIEVHGRHDPCVAPRAVPIGEAMVALVLTDHLLLNKNSRIENL
jgi:chorismate synthase